jgi:hypothetical protein
VETPAAFFMNGEHQRSGAPDATRCLPQRFYKKSRKQPHAK